MSEFKHFENLWNASEDVAKNFNDQNHIENIQKHLDKLSGCVIVEEQAKIIGDIIFELTGICHKLGINSFSALKYSMENKKAELLDPSED